MKLRHVLAFAAVGSLGALAGCVVINEEHCAYTGGTKSTPCGPELVCSRCAAENNGCVPPGALDQDCIFGGGTSESLSGTNPTSGTLDTESTATTQPTSTTSTTETTTTDEPVTTEPATQTSTDTTDTTDATDATESSATTSPNMCSGEVADNPDCSGLEPYCVEMECVGCKDLPSGCAAVEPAKPTCEPKSGRCVECLTHDDCTNLDKPTCNPDTAICAPCTEHEQCPATACNLETGRCFPESDILYVFNDGNTCSDANDGLTLEKPFCNLSAATKKLVLGKPTTIKVKSSAKVQSVPAGVPAGNYIVAIVPESAQVPTLVMPSIFPALTVLPGNTVFMLRIGISSSGSADPAVSCAGAKLWLDRQRIFNTKTAIRADNCLLHLRRTIIFSNLSGGVEVGGNDGMVWMENSFLTENNGSLFGGLRLSEAAGANLLYTTVALNKSPVPPIDCVQGWTGELKVRNSALVDPGTRISVACTKKLIETTFESDVGDKTMLLQNTFSGFEGGFFQARQNGQLKDVAVWKSGDPLTDFNDTKRPNKDGELDYAGADRPSG